MRMKSYSTYARFGWAVAILLSLIACESGPKYDVLIRNALIYDGSGNPPQQGDLGVNADTIAAMGHLEKAHGRTEIDAKGMALSPGFINMLSWATESLIADGRGMSDLLQGVTLEVMGEGWSMGPLTEDMKKGMVGEQGDIKFDITWTTLGEYLEYLEKKGVSPNIASFVGATTLRLHEVGVENRAPTLKEMERMKQLAREAMEEGALGIGSALIYAPAFFAQTDELIELCKAVAPYKGMYITHMRSEGNNLEEAVEEVITIARDAGVPAEIYHLKAAGKNNWAKLSNVINKIESARGAGIRISTDMYTYTAGSTGLDASMPPWVQEGGYEAWAKRLRDPEIRKRVKAEMQTDAQDWENLYYSTGSTDKILLVDFKNDTLKKYTGKTLTEVARLRGTDPEETAMDLVIEDGSRVGTVYFLMSEENVRKQIQLPYMSFGSDAAALANEGVFLKSSTHPRAYGNFARLLGKYVRDEKLIPLEQAISKLTALPASNLHLTRRGRLYPGFYADLVLFDPAAIQDHATYEQPQQYATGVIHVFVNGKQVIKEGQHTGATPGRVVRGPGWKGE